MSARYSSSSSLNDTRPKDQLKAKINGNGGDKISELTQLRPHTLRVRFDQKPTIKRPEIVQLIKTQYAVSDIRGIYNLSSNWFITCADDRAVEAMLENGITYTDAQGKMRVAYLDNVNKQVSTVVLSALDPAIPDQVVLDILAKFGAIHSKPPLKRELEDGIENGCRTVKMTVQTNIPQKIRLSKKGKEEIEFFVNYSNQVGNYKIHHENV